MILLLLSQRESRSREAEAPALQAGDSESVDTGTGRVSPDLVVASDELG